MQRVTPITIDMFPSVCRVYLQGLMFGPAAPACSVTPPPAAPAGTNGGVSIAGTLASLLGGALVGLVCWLTQLAALGDHSLASRPPQWPLVTTGLLAGLIGSLLDSLLGATLQFSGNSAL